MSPVKVLLHIKDENLRREAVDAIRSTDRFRATRFRLDKFVGASGQNKAGSAFARSHDRTDGSGGRDEADQGPRASH